MSGQIIGYDDKAVREMEQKMAGLAQQQMLMLERHFSTAQMIYTNLVVNHAGKQINHQVSDECLRKFATLSVEAASVFLLKFGMNVQLRQRPPQEPDPEQPQGKGYVNQG